jgi:hypothetical protein
MMGDITNFLKLDTLKACLGLHFLKNRAFKSKELLSKTFIFKLLSKKILIIFRLFGHLKAFLIFFTIQIFFFSNILFEC